MNIAIPELSQFALEELGQTPLVENPNAEVSFKVDIEPCRVTRRVGKGGRISLATFAYHVGRWLAGETVDVVVTTDGLVEISHR